MTASSTILFICTFCWGFLGIDKYKENNFIHRQVEENDGILKLGIENLKAIKNKVCPIIEYINK